MSCGIYRMDQYGKRYLAAPLPENTPDYDAIVVGGGTAGSMTAITLAASGAKTLVVERLNCMGGMATAGAVHGYYYGGRGGLYEQIDAQSKAYEPLGYTGTHPNGFNIELKKRVLENRLRDESGEIVYEADLTGVLMDGNRVLGVEYACDNGLHTARAQVVVDASAEAFVCLLAGADYEMGRALDHKVQPYSNVIRYYHEEHRTVGKDYTDSGYVCTVDPEQYTQAVMSAAKYSLYLREDYRQGHRMVDMAQIVGMREGPQIKGEVWLRLADIADGKNPSEKVLFTAYSNSDNHGKDMAFENRPQQDWMIACSLWGLNFSVNVPVGAVIPKGLDGLLMAGRLISVDHDLASCIRMERDIQKCGEAVGLLAAEAIRLGVSPRDVPYEPLAKQLRRSGCLLEANDIGFVDSRDQSRAFFPQTTQEILRGLATVEPGMAIWSARKLADKTPLYECLTASDENLRIHAAMALALADDDRGAELLLDCVKRQDSFVPMTSRKFNMIRGAAALYLLGRLAYRPALDETLRVIANWQDIDTTQFKRDEFLGDEEEYRFQYLSQAIVAALNIAKFCSEVRDETSRVIHSVIDAKDFSIHSTLKGSLQLKYQMAAMIRNAVKCLEQW